VKETRFENFIEPSTDGRDRALKQSDGAAIVIDNGELEAQGVCDSQELTIHL
jgi:hypothetical protein